MKSTLFACLICVAPALALTAAAQPTAAGAAKPAAKAAPQLKTTAVKTAKAKTAAPADVPEVVVLTPDEQRIAERVYTGRIPCELGASVQIEADTRSPGTFHVFGKGFQYHMRPVGTSTGVVRLEDQRAGAVWLQIANKSMLMNQKLGQRLADECMSEQQAAVTQAMKTAPAPSLFDTPPAGSR